MLKLKGARLKLNNFNIKDPKKKQTLIIVGIIILIVLDMFTLLGWQMRSIFSLYGTANEKKLTLQNLESDTARLQPYQRQTQELEESGKVLEVTIKNDDDMLFLIKNISSIAKENEIKIMQIDPRRTLEDARVFEFGEAVYSEVEIDMSAKTSFHRLGKFLSQIESGNIFYRVVFLEIETDNKDIYNQRIRVAFRCPTKK